MVGGFLSRFAAVAAAHPRVGPATSAMASSASLSLSRVGEPSTSAFAALASSPPASSSASHPPSANEVEKGEMFSSSMVIQIEYCEDCGYKTWAERFRSVLSAESTSSASSSTLSASSSSSPPPSSSAIPVVFKRVRAVGAFEISLLTTTTAAEAEAKSNGGGGGGGGGGGSSLISSSSSAVPLWSKLSTGQPSSVEGVAAVARLAAQEAARAAREREEGGRATAA